MLGIMNIEIYAGLPVRDRMLFRNNIKSDDPKEILIHTCNMLDLNIEDVLSKKRNKEFVTARMIAIGLTCKAEIHTLKQIGKFYKRDHSTIIYNRDTFNDLVAINDRYFNNKLNQVLIV